MPLPHVNTGSPHVAAHNAERDAINNLEENKADKSAVSGDLDALTTEVGKKATNTRVDAVEDDVDGLHETKADKSDTYTKSEVDAKDAVKADKSDTYTKSQVDAKDSSVAAIWSNPTILWSTDNLNDRTTSGIFASGSTNVPNPARNWPWSPQPAHALLRVVRRGDVYVQQTVEFVEGPMFGRGTLTRTGKSNDGVVYEWTPWRLNATQLVTDDPEQPGSKVHVWDYKNTTEIQIPTQGIPLGTFDLNLITTPGQYRQTSTPNVTPARNYPTTSLNGVLEVMAQSSNSVIQRYTVVTGTGDRAGRLTWQRTSANGTFTPWHFYSPVEVSASEVKVWDPSGNTHRSIKINPFENETLGSANLNSIYTPGIYSQTQYNTIPSDLNYPVASNGILEVSRMSGTSTLQRFRPHNGNVGQSSNIVFERTAVSGTWHPWRKFVSQRIDNTAGRAIYTWDDTQSREQLIRYDSGWRDISSLLVNDWTLGTAGRLEIRRFNDRIDLRMRNILVGTSATFLTGLPNGFRGRGVNQIMPITIGTGVYATLRIRDFERDIRVDPLPTVGIGDNYTSLSVSWPTDDPTPTTLPGTPVGSIPNL